MSRQEFAKKYELPKKDRFNIIGNLRLMEEKDVKEVGRLFRETNEKYNIYPNFSKAELAHMLLPKKGVVATYVVDDPDKKGALCDFMSFTIMHQLVLNREELGHKHERNTDATFYYYAFTKNKYADMIKQALWIVKEELECDAMVVNLIQEHEEDFLEKEMKFMKDAAGFHYYLMNYSLGDRVVQPKEVGQIFA